MALKTALILLGFLIVGSAQGQDASGLADQLGSQLFFDAERSSLNKDLNRQTFEGEVVAIGAGTIVGADEISLDRTTNKMEAKGHIVIMSRGVVFIGDAVTYDLASGDFRIIGAIM